MTKAKGNEVISHLFTSSVFRWVTPTLNQNFRSSFFNSEGFRPHSEAPGISFSSRRDVADTAMFVLLQPQWPRSDVIVTILSKLSAIMKVVYLIRVSRGDWLGNAANFKRPAYCFDFDVERRSHVTSKVHKFSRWRTRWTIYLCLAMISRRF